MKITVNKKQKINNLPKIKLKSQTKINNLNLNCWNLFNFCIPKSGLSFFNYRTNSKELYISLIFSLIPILLLVGCSYSFTGSSVPSHLKTIYIPYCNDKSGSGEATVADDFTNALIEQFISDNSLAVSESKDADALLDCTINSISDTPVIIESGEDVSARRVTISARVIYKDFVLKKTVFDKTFSNYGDYENSGDILSKREKAIQIAIDKITEDILLGVVSDW